VKTVAAFLRLSRPHFLVGGVLLATLGALSAPPIDLSRLFLAQLLVTSAQITAHYVNEYADYEADLTVANRTSFSGGSGVLVAGALTRSTALLAASVTTFVTLIAVALVARFSVVGAAAGVAALAVSWAYSMPPVRLLNTGWGELATTATVTGLVPLIGALAQGNNIAPALWWMVAALSALHFAMLLAFELPDLESDAAAGKRVFAVRVGWHASVVVIAVLFALAVAVITVGWIGGSLSFAMLLGFGACVPAAVVTLWAVRARRHRLTTLAAVAALVLANSGLLIATN